MNYYDDQYARFVYPNVVRFLKFAEQTDAEIKAQAEAAMSGPNNYLKGIVYLGPIGKVVFDKATGEITKEVNPDVELLKLTLPLTPYRGIANHEWAEDDLFKVIFNPSRMPFFGEKEGPAICFETTITRGPTAVFITYIGAVLCKEYMRYMGYEEGENEDANL